jgi:hypothetical protein
MCTSSLCDMSNDISAPRGAKCSPTLPMMISNIRRRKRRMLQPVQRAALRAEVIEEQRGRRQDGRQPSTSSSAGRAQPWGSKCSLDMNASVMLHSMAGARILTWNGKDLPGELRDLPAGRYAVESIDDVSTLTPEEEDGLRQALTSLRTGKGRTVEQVRETIDAEQA